MEGIVTVDQVTQTKAIIDLVDRIAGLAFSGLFAFPRYESGPHPQLDEINSLHYLWADWARRKHRLMQQGFKARPGTVENFTLWDITTVDGCEITTLRFQHTEISSVFVTANADNVYLEVHAGYMLQAVVSFQDGGLKLTVEQYQPSHQSGHMQPKATSLWEFFKNCPPVLALLQANHDLGPATHLNHDVSLYIRTGIGNCNEVS
jgi:hypothetical protein